MAGIDLTDSRRSQLLETLLAQQVQPQNPQTAISLAARLGAQLLRQKKIEKLRQEEAGRAKTERSNEVAALQKLLGQGDVDFQGRPVTDQQGNQQNNISLAQALSQLASDNPRAQAIEEQLIAREFATPKDTRTSLRKDFEFAKEEGFQGSFTDFIAKTRQSTIEKGGFKVPAGFMVDPEDPNKVIPIPGGPKDTLSPTDAAKVQLVESALKDSREFGKFIVGEDGAIDRTNIANMNIGTPFTEGRSANVLLLNSIEAKLRAESGAAVPETEVKRAGKRFRPRLIDSDETIKVKLRLLNDFLEGAFNKSQRDGRFDVKATVDAIDAAANEAGIAPDTSDEDEERLKELGF